MPKRKRRRGSTALRDAFVNRGKGTTITITIGAELVHTLDDIRHQVDELSGIVPTRAQVLEGLLKKVWWDYIQEASALEAGADLSDQIGNLAGHVDAATTSKHYGGK